jgi:hypothetical protein
MSSTIKPRAMLVCEHGVLADMECSQCKKEAQAAASIPTVKPTMISIILKDGQGMVQIPVPDPANFNFNFWCNMVRSSGGVMTDTTYVPLENILLCGMGDVQTQPMAPSGRKTAAH